MKGKEEELYTGSCPRRLSYVLSPDLDGSVRRASPHPSTGGKGRQRRAARVTLPTARPASLLLVVISLEAQQQAAAAAAAGTPSWANQHPRRELERTRMQTLSVGACQLWAVFKRCRRVGKDSNHLRVVILNRCKMMQSVDLNIKGAWRRCLLTLVRQQARARDEPSHAQ